MDLQGIAKIERFLDKIEGLDTSDVLFPLSDSTLFCKQTRTSGRNVCDLPLVLDSEPCKYSGGLDNDGEAHGPGTLNFQKTGTFQGIFSHGLENREGFRYLPGDIAKISGTWIRGNLEGYARTEMLTGEWFEGVYKDGERQGFFREFGIDYHLKEFTRYQGNKRVGWTYEGKLGGGYLIGLVDDEGKMTGDNIIYMYPDFRTGLRGSFEDGVMKSAQLSAILSSEEVDGVCIPVLSEPTSEDIYFFDPATSTRISRQPLLQDPWERCLVEVKTSKLDQAGHGLFAREEIPEKTVVALFAGIRLKEHQLAKHKKSNYRIILNSAINLDIPQECICTSNYCATLAHKANHSFTPNSEWSIFEHPRFGLIRAISAKQDIQVGEEILVNYNIELSTAPEWYRILWLRHLMEDKDWTLQDVERFLDRHYDLSFKRIPLPTSLILQVPTPFGASTEEEEEQAEAEEEEKEEEKDEARKEIEEKMK